MPPGLLRLLLALIVVFHHSLGFFGFGAVAVYLFFVLSGYWTSRMWDEKYSKLRLPVLTFFASRWLRIAPVLLLTLLLAMLVGRWFPGTFPASTLDAMATWNWWLPQIFLVSITTQPLILVPTWSLAVEMQFYLLLPLLVIMWSRWRLGNLIFGAILAMVAVGLFLSGSPPISGNVFLYLLFFWFGVRGWKGAPLSKQMTLWGAGAFFAIVLTTLMVPEWRILLTNYPEGRTPAVILHQGIYSYLISILLVPFALSTVRRKGGSWDRTLGNLSFPLYLFHMIPISLYYAYRGQWGLPGVASLALCWAACGIGGLVILFLIDKPFERLRHRALRLAKQPAAGKLPLTKPAEQ